MEELEQLGIIPVDYAVLRSLFADYYIPRIKSNFTIKIKKTFSCL